jgi:hypothetical protein
MLCILVLGVVQIRTRLHAGICPCACKLSLAQGSNDVANAFGTSVGAKVVSIRSACLIAAIFDTAGSFPRSFPVIDMLKCSPHVPHRRQILGATAPRARAHCHYIVSWFLVNRVQWGSVVLCSPALCIF